MHAHMCKSSPIPQLQFLIVCSLLRESYMYMCSPIHTHKFLHSHVHTCTCTLASSSDHAHLFVLSHMCREPGNEFTCTHTQSTLACIHLIYHIVILALGVCTHAPSKGSHSIHMYACSYTLAHTTHPHTPTLPLHTPPHPHCTRPHTPTAHSQVSSEGGHSVQV